MVSHDRSQFTVEGSIDAYSDRRLFIGVGSQCSRYRSSSVPRVGQGVAGRLHLRRDLKIEEVFLRTDDQDGLAKYYAAWLDKNHEDIEAMARLGRSLAVQGRAAEARAWLDKAVKLAPSRRALRLALIEQLVQEKKFAEAYPHAEEIKQLPQNPQACRDISAGQAGAGRAEQRVLMSNEG